jgi:tetratricopeptide (TPR) repeat protein
LAYYSKLSAIVFIALIPLTLYFFTKLKFKNIALVFGVLAVAYVGIRLFNRSFLPGSFRPKQYIENPLVFMEMSERLPTAFYILIFYLKKIILPFPLLFYYGYNTIEIQGWGSLWVIISILSCSTFFNNYYYYGFKKKSIYSFGILFYLMVIAMYSNILRPPMGIVADRFLFVAVLPFSIIVVYGVKQIFLKTKSKISLNKRLLYFGIAILLIYSIITIDRNKDWYNQETLVSNDIGKLKNSARANFIYAGMLKVELYDKIKKYQQNPLPSDVEKIKLYLNRAIDVYPEYYEAWDMLGTIHHILEGNSKMAIVCFEKAISINSNYIKSYQNLAFVYNRNGENEKALGILEKAYNKRPYSKTTILDLIDVNKALNDSSKVEFYAEKLKGS